MPKLSDLKVTIGLSGIRTLNKQLRDVQGKFRRNFGAIAGLARNLAVGIGATLGGAVAVLIKKGAEMETLRTSFVSLTGSVNQAAAVVADLNAFAANTPFMLEDISNAARKLLATGSRRNDLAEELKFLGDVAASSGNSINDIAAIFTKVRAKGKVELENLNQLAERNIPIFDELRKVTGDANMEFGAGAVSVDEFSQALRNMAAEGGIAEDAMKNLSETVAGRFTTLMDNLGLELSRAAEKTGLTAGTNKLLEGLTESLKGISGTAGSDVTAAIGKAEEAIASFGTLSADNIDDVETAILDAHDALAGMLQVMVASGATPGGNPIVGFFKQANLESNIDNINAASAATAALMEVWEQINQMQLGEVAIPEYTAAVETNTEATADNKKKKEELIAVEKSYLQTLGEVKELQSDTAVDTLAAAYSAHQLRGSYEVLDQQVRQVGNAHEHLSATVQNATRALFDNIRDSSKGFHEYLKNMIADLLVRVAGLIAAFGILSLLTGGATGVATLMGPGTKAGLGHFLAGGLGITGFATGGMVTGPTLAMVGEGSGTSLSNPEVIAPLNKLQQMLGGQAITVSGMIRGNDILISNERSLLDRNRVRGF